MCSATLGRGIEHLFHVYQHYNINFIVVYDGY